MDKLEGRGMSFGRLGGGEEEAGLSGGGALILWCSLTGPLSRDGRAVSRGPRRPLGWLRLCWRRVPRSYGQRLGELKASAGRPCCLL